MKLRYHLLYRLVVVMAALAPLQSACAQSRSSSSYSVGSESLSAGVSEGSSPSYASTSSTGLPPPTEQESEGYTATPDLSGQLAVPLGFALGGPEKVRETRQAVFVPAMAMDDGTFDLLAAEAGDTFQLTSPSPYASMDAQTGIMTTTPVLEDQILTVSLDRGAAQVSQSVTLSNSIPDNFGSYAYDGLDDTWQIFYFGSDNPDAAPGEDPEKDSLTNLKEFALGFHPRLPSLFTPIPSRNGTSTFQYSYRRSSKAFAMGARYHVEWSDTLLPLSWSSAGVTETIHSDDGEMQEVCASVPAPPTSLRRFARLRIGGIPPP